MKKLLVLIWSGILVVGLSISAWSQNPSGNNTQTRQPAKKETKEQRKARRDSERAKRKADRDAKKQQTSKKK